jgi:ABC-type glycerol-3-phosphate transport system substrate-binding protein
MTHMKFGKGPRVNPGKRFLRRVASATVLTLAVLASAGVASAGIVTPHRIDETFTGASIDYTLTWWFWNTNQPDSVRFNQANGVMNINIAASAQNDFNGGGATLCRAGGVRRNC